ncbi:hypothetical protein [Micromonospora rubida]|uniref:hypothetical protein n=1 Tax=Micromonospora rubida TaxID=2697657 RepID=UPI001F4242FE
MPHLDIALIGEQAGREQEVDHDTGRQQADPLLDRAAALQSVVDHVERHQLGQLTQMARREPARRDRPGMGYGNLIRQRSSRC